MRRLFSPNTYRLFCSASNKKNVSKILEELTEIEIRAIQIKQEREARAKIDPKYAKHFYRMEKINQEAQRQWDSLSPEEKEKLSGGPIDSEELRKSCEEYAASLKYYSAY